jgi:hypothetical protein
MGTLHFLIPHPEEPTEGRRLEGWKQAPRLRPSFETHAFGALLKMRELRVDA